MIKKYKKIYFFLLFFLFLSVKTVFGQTDWSLQLNWPDSPGGASLSSSSTIAELVNYLFEWGIIIGIILTFGTLVYASLKYITSAGNSQKLSKAKNMLSSSFLGLLLLFSSWLLISILNPQLTVISNIKIPKINPGKQSLEINTKKEEDFCNYGIISYTLRSNGNLEKVIIQRGEVDFIGMEPYSAIMCKSEEGFGDSVIEEGQYSGKIKFIKARTLYGVSEKKPVCDLDCAKTTNESCPDEIYLSFDQSQQDMPKYCYDNYSVSGGRFQYSRQHLYISQNPDSSQTTCLAGDKKLPEGGGCALNLGATELAGGCGDVVTMTNPTGSDISQSYDKPIECIGVIRHQVPVPNNISNTGLGL